MKRTYRSKKETGGGLDPRDVVLAMDEKASVFDAFYIQNIKQTKREMSVGASMFAASNKVRKKKYVKRLKDQESPAIRESTSRSAYLTPDKSIHLKRELDPFDLLLISPSTNKVPIKPVINVSSPLHTRGKGKTYRKKAPYKKKINYCSSDTDSVNENCMNESNLSQNLSDVLSHKLEIEKGEKVISIDQSINNIVNNLSLSNKIEEKNLNSTSLLSLSVKDNLNMSLVKSPLCSTPFHKKYKGQSIYKFSPISAFVDDPMTNKPEESNRAENKNHENSVQNSPVLGDVNVFPYQKSIDGNEFNSPILQYRRIKQSIDEKNKLKVEMLKHYHQLFKCKEVSFLQTSEEEPFLGFSKTSASSTQNINLEAIAKKYEEINKEIPDVLQKSRSYIDLTKTDGVVKTIIENVHNNYSSQEEYNDAISNPVTTTEDVSIIETSVDGASSHIHSEKNFVKAIENEHSFIDVRTSEPSQIYSVENSIVENELSLNEENTSETSKESKISEKEHSINDECNISALSQPYSEENSEIENEISSHEESTSEPSSIYSEQNSTNNNQNSSIEKSTSDRSIDTESLYESCNSENEMSEFQTHNKELAVVLERLTDSEFNKYYKKDANLNCDLLQSDETNNESHSCEISSRYSSINENDTLSEYLKSSGYRESDENCLQEDTMMNISNIDEDVDCNYENNKSDDDIFVSFVTRRKRNEVTKNSFILSFENSPTSTSSGDFDKTVLSNNKCSLNSLKESTDNTLIHDAHINYNNLADSNQICDGEHSLLKENTLSETDAQTELAYLPEIERISVANSGVITRRSSKLSDNIKRTITKEDDLTSKNTISCKKSAVLPRTSNRLSIDNIRRPSSNAENDLITRKSVAPQTATTRKSSRLYRESVNTKSSLVAPQKFDVKTYHDSAAEIKQGIVLEPGKRWERSLSIFRRVTTMGDQFDHSILDEEQVINKGRKYRQSVIYTMEMQDVSVSLHNESVRSRRSTFYSKPSRSTIKILRESNASRISLSSTSASEDLGFLTEDCDDTIIELSKLSIIDSEHEVTVLDKFNDTSNRITTARDYVLRRCNQTDVILFDECYPDTVLKNCRKIGEGVYGEVFLWRAGDGRARVLKIVPIAGDTKVNGESQKDYHEIISEIVIAMELSALRTPIADIEKHLDEGQGVETLDLHSVENATDVFNEVVLASEETSRCPAWSRDAVVAFCEDVISQKEAAERVLAVRCVYGSYPSRLLDLWELYDECKGSENDNPAILPADQQFMVLELANAGQDLESYQFHNAEQAYALFQQVAFGLAVAEEAFQFEHRDLHWGNVLIAPTDQKYATFVLRGRAHRVLRRGVAATVIDYSLSRLSLRLPSADTAALYNDLAADDGLFDAVGDYQFEVYRLMRDKLGNDWKNFEPYTNILWLHYTVDKMITALRYTRTNTKIHKHYIAKLKEIKNRILDYGSAVQFILTDNEI